MITLHTLSPAEGSTKRRKRVGRGQGSGRGGTSTRGHKGAKSRSGNSRKLGFEGGQMPLQRRVPKFGFKNPARVSYDVVNVGDLQALLQDHPTQTVDVAYLVSHSLVSKKKSTKVKLLGNGEISSAVDVEVHAFSKSAQEAIEKAGGKATVI